MVLKCWNSYHTAEGFLVRNSWTGSFMYRLLTCLFQLLELLRNYLNFQLRTFALPDLIPSTVTQGCLLIFFDAVIVCSTAQNDLVAFGPVLYLSRFRIPLEGLGVELVQKNCREGKSRCDLENCIPSNINCSVVLMFWYPILTILLWILRKLSQNKL